MLEKGIKTRCVNTRGLGGVQYHQGIARTSLRSTRVQVNSRRSTGRRNPTCFVDCSGGTGNGGGGRKYTPKTAEDDGEKFNFDGSGPLWRSIALGVAASAAVASIGNKRDRDCLAVDPPAWLSEIFPKVTIQRRVAKQAIVEAPKSHQFSSIVGRGTTLPVLEFSSKAFLSWCTNDTELASSAVDLGFLTFLGGFCIFALENDLANTRPFLIHVILSHLFLEMVFESALLPMLDSRAKSRLSVDMLVHHIGSLATGMYCLHVGGGAFNTGSFLKQGIRLALTEVTTALPVAFKQAIKHKRLNGKRRIIFAAVMPVAFVWRSVYSFNVLTSFLKEVDRLGGAKVIPSWWLGATCFGSVVGCNVFWTGKVLNGVLRTLKSILKRKKANKKAENNGTDNAQSSTNKAKSAT